MLLGVMRGMMLEGFCLLGMEMGIWDEDGDRLFYFSFFVYL